MFILILGSIVPFFIIIISIISIIVILFMFLL